MTAAHAGTTHTPTRYQRVPEILQAAAGTSKAGYGGAGRFWEHGLTAFKAAKVHYSLRVSGPARLVERERSVEDVESPRQCGDSVTF
jgi:hypothetical protein